MRVKGKERGGTTAPDVHRLSQQLSGLKEGERERGTERERERGKEREREREGRRERERERERE